MNEDLVRRLAAAIDADEPPGLAATTLARAVVELVRDRESIDALHLAGEIETLAHRYPRDR
jgi:hypothetical protein